MVNKREIYHCNLDPVKGSEQKGVRPVLIISNNSVNHNIPVATIIPFSSYNIDDKIYPTETFLPKEITGLHKDSILMIHQIRTISQSRLRKKEGSIENKEFQENIKPRQYKYHPKTERELAVEEAQAILMHSLNK